jgi:hypothetical protein
MGLILWLLIVVGALFLVGVIGSPAAATGDAVDPSLPTSDVAGADFSDLPRMTDAMRVEYKDFLQGQWAVTEVEYLAEAPMTDVQFYYRQAFLNNGWNLLSVDTTGHEWVYAIASGMREGVVEMEEVDGFVNIEIELHRLVAPTKIGDENAK